MSGRSTDAVHVHAYVTVGRMSTTKGFVRPVAVAFLAAVVLGGVAGGAAAQPTAKPHPMAPCVGEDGFGPAPCWWDAATRGNRQGHSFISPNGNGEDLIYLN